MIGDQIQESYGEKSANNIMLSTIDFNLYERLTYQRQTDSSNCYLIFTSIQILRNCNDAYFLLKTHTCNPLNVYANNGQLYKPNCKTIELFTYIIGKHCFKKLQIIYKSENNEERGGFLTRDLIIRNTANPIPCEIKSDIIIEKSPNKNIIKLNRELIQRNVDLQLLDTIDLQGKIIYSLNSHHPKALFNELDELEILEKI